MLVASVPVPVGHPHQQQAAKATRHLVAQAEPPKAGPDPSAAAAETAN
jgi:hypothetical protein